MLDSEETFTATEEEIGYRLDKVLAQRFQGIKSRTYFQTLIDEHHVLVNGEPAKKRVILKLGDEIQVNFILTPEIGITPEPIPLDILFEDDHLIAINKPAGMVVHPAVGNWSGTFVNALLYHCQQLPESSHPLRPGIVHRLDKDTSGILLAAKTSVTQERLVAMFSSRKIKKEYVAICYGKPNVATLEAPIGRHPIHRQKMAIQPTGRHATTHFEIISRNKEVSVLKILLETGRTHQIRVHLQHLGTPVLGDNLYGNVQANAKLKASRQLLHAWRLSFDHPITNQSLALEAPFPEDISSWLKKLSVPLVD